MKKLLLILMILPLVAIAKVGKDSRYIELCVGSGVTNYY